MLSKSQKYWFGVIKVVPLFLSVFILSTCQMSPEAGKMSLLIENIAVIDPISGLQANYSILIEGDQISKVAPVGDMEAPNNARVVDGSGKYLIPGLWDAHVHFAFIEEIAGIMPDLFLAYGITSVRDTGGKIDFVKPIQNQSQADPINYPRIMIAGPLLDGMPNVYDGSDNGHPPLSVGHGTVEDLAKSITQLDSIGVDLLKAYEMLSEEQFRHLGTTAKALQLPLTGHIPLSMDAISASNAGLGGMEHLRNLELSCASNAEELLSKRRELLKNMDGLLGGALRSSIHQAQRAEAIANYDTAKAREVIEVLRKNDTYQIPTISLISGLYQRHWSEEAWVESFSYLPDSIELAWKDWLAGWIENPPSASFKMREDWSMMFIKEMYDEGVPFLAGTDTPILFATPGLSLHKELALLVQAGFSPLDALKTATINPAKYFGMDAQLGRIQPGMIADLLILNANPLENIQNTLAIEAVIKNGAFRTREAIDQRLEQLTSQP